jgi:hypothetical protein
MSETHPFLSPCLLKTDHCAPSVSRHRLELMRRLYNDDYDGSSDDVLCPSSTASPTAAQPASSCKLVLASLPPRYTLEFLPANMCVTPHLTQFLAYRPSLHRDHSIRMERAWVRSIMSTSLLHCEFARF